MNEPIEIALEEALRHSLHEELDPSCPFCRKEIRPTEIGGEGA